ncbi:MAG: hypothetical protein HY074_01510 [Deltaproteobacteria bacterium]|nr:hypothetical protein [Deltaproteobacteria bacterium]
MNKITLLCFLALSLCTSHANAAVTLLDKDEWKISMGGFVELDSIVDSTRSFTEVEGNSAVSRDSVAGQTGRTQFSIRNTRLAFSVEPPEFESWKTKGYFEFDLLGFDPAPGTTNTEAAFFNNPSFRVRHTYLSAEREGWQILGGQYWNMLGWQPYYFMPTVQVAPITGMLYGRTGQIRVTKTVTMDNNNTMQAALGIMRPPQRDASLPGLEGGMRIAFGNRTAGFAGGSTAPQKNQPLSFGLSGAVREFVTPQSPLAPTGDLTHVLGYAGVADALIPVIASSDGKDPSNTLVFGGEFTTGKGYGDQLVGYTGGLGSPLNSIATAPEKNMNLDAGIGGFDSSGNFQLVDLRTFNAYFQYHLPGTCRTWFSGGYGRLYSDNINTMVGATGKTSAGNFPYDKVQTYFANWMHDVTKQIRVGFEYAFSRTEYGDAYVAHNNRYQLSAFFIF